MDILEKIAVRNVTQNVEAVIFTVAFAILDVNQDGTEKTVLKVLFFAKKQNKKQKHTFYVVSGLFPVLSIFIAFLFCQLSQTKLLTVQENGSTFLPNTLVPSIQYKQNNVLNLSFVKVSCI